MRPLRIVFITRRYWPLVGGPASAAARLTQALAARGHEARIVTPRWSRNWPPAVSHRGVPVTRLEVSTRLWGNFQYARALTAWLRAEQGRIDLVSVFELQHDAAAAAAAGRKLGLPVALWAMRAGLSGDCHWQIEAAFGRRIKKHCMTAGAVVAPTPTIYEEVVAAGYDRDRIHLLPFGVTVGSRAEETAKATCRANLADSHLAFQTPESAPLALFLGRVDETKGLHYLIHAWPEVVRRLPLARLWIVGDGPLRGEFVDLAESLGLSDHVLAPGPFDHVEDLLGAADVFVQPATDAGTCQALLEAMAAGKAICASDIPDHRHILAGGECGLLVPPEDPDALAAGLAKLLGDSSLAGQLGRAAYERVKAEYSLDTTTERFIELAQGLISHAARPTN